MLNMFILIGAPIVGTVFAENAERAYARLPESSFGEQQRLLHLGDRDSSIVFFMGLAPIATLVPACVLVPIWLLLFSCARRFVWPPGKLTVSNRRSSHVERS